MYSSLGIDGLESGSFTEFNTSPWPNGYWSSTSYSNNEAYIVGFVSGTLGGNNRNDFRYIRPIRSFGYTLGCMDSLACNYNPEANMADGSCVYPEQGYDCEGNINVQVGDEAFGGIVFYVDETGERGLVAAMEDLEGTYEWGCYGVEVLGADGTSIGTGNQNTLDIVNQGCTTENGGITAAQAALDSEINGYNDWYLPSQNELYELYELYDSISDPILVSNYSTYWS